MEHSGSFYRDKHVKYFLSCLSCLPFHYVGLDTAKLSAVYFAVVGLDILGALDSINKEDIAEYVYRMQIIGHTGRNCSTSKPFGFIGSAYLSHTLCTPGIKADLKANGNESVCCNTIHSANASRYQVGHIAMTYTALATLVTLGDDLSRVGKSDVVSGLRELQRVDGSFGATVDDCESDMRFLYCACAISTMLGDWSGVDTDRAVQYVLQCITYEGGISLLPGTEAQGGTCFCGLASLALMGRMGDLSKEQHTDLLGWCERRQATGYEGRTGKEPDSCYAFWIGGTISLLQAFSDTDIPSTRGFLLGSCQYSEHSGGFSKLPDTYPDILHTFYSICWLSMAGMDNLRPINVALGICADKFQPLTESL